MYSRHTKSIIGGFVLWLFMFSISGCASGPKVMTDYDKAADFGSYKTYNFVDGAGPDYGEYQSLFTKFVLEAVAVEMEKRGYVKSDNPDLLVNFGARLDEKLDVRTTSAPMAGGYYGYRSGAYRYGAWSGYGYGTETQVSQYTEGTFNIDIIDSKRRQLVWEAVGIGKITDKKRENLEKTIKSAVPVYFSGYPFVAGNPNPVISK